MRKRGQLLGQPLIMIFALIVGALILAWGAYEIYKLLSFSCEVESRDFISTLKNNAQRYYYYEQGSSNRFQIRLPCDDNAYICFANHSSTLNPNPTVKPPNYNSGFVNGRKGDNVFIFSKKEVFAFNVPYLSPREGTATNPTCVKNYQYVTFTSQGTFVEVTRANV
ncbi:MAG: hypothetical protein QXR60_01145 [Candidatus Nanoarchaeia archaeon]